MPSRSGPIPARSRSWSITAACSPTTSSCPRTAPRSTRRPRSSGPDGRPVGEPGAREVFGGLDDPVRRDAGGVRDPDRRVLIRRRSPGSFQAGARAAGGELSAIPGERLAAPGMAESSPPAAGALPETERPGDRAGSGPYGQRPVVPQRLIGQHRRGHRVLPGRQVQRHLDRLARQDRGVDVDRGPFWYTTRLWSSTPWLWTMIVSRPRCRPDGLWLQAVLGELDLDRPARAGEVVWPHAVTSRAAAARRASFVARSPVMGMRL